MVKSKMSPEVLMYLQNIKKYFNNNEYAQKYFSIKGNEDVFYKYIEETSQKNFEDNGEPELSLEQFENIREKISGSADKPAKPIGLFISMGELGYFSLN